MSKFLDLENFETTLSKGYRLLPFRFDRLEGDDYVLTNQAGEVYILPRPVLDDFVNHRLHFDTLYYKDLKSKHMLIDDDSSVAIDLLALKVRTKLSRLANFTGLHLFVVSLRCDHSCPYCQVSRQSDDRLAFDMSIATAERALELVFQSPNPAIKIEFQGGEPLINFPLIKHIVRRAQEINAVACRNLQFVIATNLALIDDDVINFCRAHQVLISTSLDGPADLHNKNRPRPGRDSYERTVSGIDRVRAALGRDSISALMTTTEASLGRVREIIDEYITRGFSGIFLRTLSPYGFAIKTKLYNAYSADRWLEFYFEGLDYIIEINRAGHFFVEHYASILLTKILTPFSPGYVDLQSPAGIGTAAVVYNYNGDVFASDESRMLAEMGDATFKIGNVHENSFDEIFLSDSLLNPLEESFTASAPMCTDCAFEPFCGADPVFHHATQGDFLGCKPKSKFCTRNLAIFRRLISLARQDVETQRIFHRWVSHAC